MIKDKSENAEWFVVVTRNKTNIHQGSTLFDALFLNRKEIERSLL